MHADRTRRQTLLALAAALGMPGALRLALAQSTASQGMRTARGEVRINGRLADTGALVLANDTVETGTGAHAAFVVGEDAFLVRESSRADLIGSGPLVSALQLVTGKLLSVFGPGKPRLLLTSTATIGIRGTGAYLEAEPVRTYFCLCYGTADVASTSGERESYATSHHESPRYIYRDERERTIAPAYMSNHADSELMLLESLVGRTPPTEFMMGGGRY